MPEGMPFDQMPDIPVDNFDEAGMTAKGPMKIRLEEWTYKPPSGGYDEGILNGRFAVLERPDVGPVDESVRDSFFLSPNSLWKLINLATGMGLHYDGKTNFKDVAADCIGRECWAYCDHQKGKDGRTYTRLTAFGANLSEVMDGAPKSDSGSKSL